MFMAILKVILGQPVSLGFLPPLILKQREKTNLCDHQMVKMFEDEYSHFAIAQV